MYKLRIPIAIACLALTLLGSRWAGQTQNAPVRPTDELAMLEIPFYDWAQLDLDLSERETEVIRPEAALLRRYESPDDGLSAELTVIAGRHKRSVHTPGYCLPGSGWEVVQQEATSMTLPGGRKIPIVHSIMTNDAGQQMAVVYFFTDGNFATNNIARYQFNQLLKRLRKQSSFGAMVRLIIPIHEGVDTDAFIREFANAAFPKVMDKLKELGERK